MNRPALRTVAALTLVLLTGACSSFRIPFFGDKEENQSPYADARAALSGKALEVPPDLVSPGTSGNYNIPGLDKVALSPEGQKVLESGAVAPRFDKVRLVNEGGQRWLVVNAPVERVWPQARQFWLDEGFELKVDNPTAAILQTNFRERRPDLPVGTLRAALARGLGTLYSTGIADQYRMQLDRGVEPNTTEIYIRHQCMEEVYTDRENRDTRWTPKQPDPLLEAEMLKKLLVRLGVTADAAEAVVTAAAQPDAVPVAQGSERVEFLRVDGEPQIRVNESFDRAWRRVGLALERAGLMITDRDRQRGTYYVKPNVLQQAKDDPGFWSRLAFWKHDDKGKKGELPQDPEYLIVLTVQGSQTTVKLAGKDGGALTPDAKQKMLEPVVVELR